MIIYYASKICGKKVIYGEVCLYLLYLNVEAIYGPYICVKLIRI